MITIRVSYYNRANVLKLRYIQHFLLPIFSITEYCGSIVITEYCYLIWQQINNDAICLITYIIDCR